VRPGINGTWISGNPRLAPADVDLLAGIVDGPDPLLLIPVGVQGETVSDKSVWARVGRVPRRNRKRTAVRMRALGFSESPPKRK